MKAFKCAVYVNQSLEFQVFIAYVLAENAEEARTLAKLELSKLSVKMYIGDVNELEYMPGGFSSTNRVSLVKYLARK